MPTDRLDALILDFDGTIADTIPCCIEAYQATLEEHGRPRPSVAQVIAGFGPSEEGMLELEFGPQAWRNAHRTFLRHYERLHAEIPAPFAGAVELFEELARRQRLLGIVTGKGRASLDVSLRVLGIEHYFPAKHRESGSSHGAIKLECLQRLLGRWGIQPARTAYVGDMASDVHVAREAGVVAIAARWASNVDHDALLASDPDLHFASFDELGAWVRPRC
ncbi:MAG: HAD family hydrolase [Planctomycetota bacterium]